MTRRLAGLAGIVLALGVAVPASASSPARFTINDTFERTYSCGVQETTLVTGSGTVHFDGNGDFLFVSIQFTYDGSFTDPASGRTITQEARQHVVNDGSTITWTGQGVFLRMKGEGVVQHDVGRLVAVPSNGSTISATPKVLRVDDPGLDARVDAAVCSMFD